MVMHWNAESVTNKKTELEHILHERNIQICCIQETHLQSDKSFKVRGYQCFRSDRTDRSKGGVLTLVRNNIQACLISTHMEDSEYQVLKLQASNAELKLVNFYCPNNKPLSLDSISMEDTNMLVVGDFNSHSQSWGYNHMDRRGEEVEAWQDENHLLLINNPFDCPTFYSRRWHTTSTPDLAFCTKDIHGNVKREIGKQLGGSDHRPVFLQMNLGACTEAAFPRWNYKKADWSAFKHRTSALTKDISVQGRDINMVVKDFNSCILKAARETIPRGARRNYKPYWSKELQELQDKLSEARKTAEDHPSIENNNKLQEAKARFLKHKLQASKRSWREKTASLNFEKDGRKLWRLTKQLNDEDNSRTKVSLEDNGNILSGKQAANKFADCYAAESNISVGPTKQREARREQRERPKKTTLEPMKQSIKLAELQTALKKLKARRSPGPDAISNEMLTHLGNSAVNKLLEIFNLSWEEGKLPQIWREAIMIPILKKGKDPKQASSYRPISLTSCVVKTMERIVNERLRWHLETTNLLASEQAGFRQFRSTEDQATYLSQEIEEAFQEQKLVFAAWIDLQKAFDKVWTEGLLVKLLRNGVAGNMFTWIKSYLFNHRARVSLDSKTNSKKFLLRHGVPQGGVLSPTLFLLFINDLVAELPKGVKAALYADDLVLWCKEEYASTATYRLQQAANMLQGWAEEWCVSINKEKSSTTLFTLSPKQKAGTIRLGNTPLKEDEEATYLGVTFDKKMTWKSHITKAEMKARRKLAILRKLAGTTWGANEKTLKTVYQGSVRPHLEYGSTAWSTCAKTTQQALDKVQNQALRIITGAMRSTPIKAMEQLTGIQPLNQRREAKIMVQAQKFRCLPDHPMKSKLDSLTKNRLKRSSFVHESKRLSRQYVEQLPKDILPLQATDLPRPWLADQPAIEVYITVPHLIPDEQNDPVKRVLTLAMIAEKYPKEAWTHVYTDGSATNAVADGGAGITVKFSDGETTDSSCPTGKHCTNYRAETEALMQAASIVQTSDNDFHQVVFLSDALSVLQAFQNNKLPHLTEALQQVAHDRRVVLQWIPAHCGVPGNELADRLAKQGARKEQPENGNSYSEIRSIIRTLTTPTRTRDEYHLLSREQQSVLVRLRTGHNRLNCHMARKLKLAPSPTCPCKEADQTAEHVLQACPHFSTIRAEVWPEGETLETKLYGCYQDLEKTTLFISRTGLTV